MKNSFDVAQFIDFKPTPAPTNYEVLRDRHRGHQFGKLIGTIRLKRSRYSHVVMQFPDGTYDTFTLHEIAPVVPDPKTSDQPTTITA